MSKTINNINKSLNNCIDLTTEQIKVSEEDTMSLLKSLQNTWAWIEENEELLNEVSDKIGSDELETENKTIIGAINELFQNGNNVKQKLVDALIAKNYPVSTSNSWDELISFISDNIEDIIPCTSITTDVNELNITALSSEKPSINYTLSPTNTTEDIIYTMDDSKIAFVSERATNNKTTGVMKISYLKNGSTNLRVKTMSQEKVIPINVDINLIYNINVLGDFTVEFSYGMINPINGVNNISTTKPYGSEGFNMYVRGSNNKDVSEEDIEIKITGDYGSGSVDLSGEAYYSDGEFVFYIENRCNLNIEIQEANKIVNPAIMRGAAVGESYSLILDDGYLYGAGYNGYGQLGQGNSTSNDDWCFVKNNLIESNIARGEIAQIACGRYFSAILKTDGTIWTTGDNEGYATGHTSRKLSFTKVEGISNVKQISCGSNFMMAVKHDGTLWACGSNNNYQLGLGSSGDVSTFTQVTNRISNDVKQVACGGDHVLVLKTDGTLWACGSNSYGQYGNGDDPSRDGNYGVFLEIDTGKNIDFIACGKDCSFFVTTGRRMYSAGLNDCGQLGTGGFDNKTEFTLVNSISEITAIESSYSTTYVKSSNRAYSVGGNEYGQLGIGNTTNKQFFQNIGDKMTLASASPNAEHMVIFNDNTHYACGSGSYGCLGGAGKYGQDYAWFGQVTLQ